jgi:hypothetical protein
MTDFSKFDGSISYFLRIVERKFYLSCYEKKYHEEFLRYLDNDIDVKSKTQNSVTYNSGSSRLSGSAITTEGNTIVNAFVDYCALRLQKQSPEKAFKHIGLKYGDDGLCSAKTITKVCMDLGLKIKIEKAKKGEPITFLSRIFIDPWRTTTSFQDPIRFIPKISVTTSQLPDQLALANKIYGYHVTDPLTPIIKGMVRRYLVTDNIDLEHDREIKRKVRLGPWPQDKADEDDILQIFARVANIPIQDLVDYDTLKSDHITTDTYGDGLNNALKTLECIKRNDRNSSSRRGHGPVNGSTFRAKKTKETTEASERQSKGQSRKSFSRCQVQSRQGKRKFR